MTDRNERGVRFGVFLAVVMVSLLVVSAGRAVADEPAAATGPTTSSDWPQWRGPTRDGIAGPGPKLADAWPEGGPKLLWKSAPIPTGYDGPFKDSDGYQWGADGGLGSVTLVGDKAFVYVHWKKMGTPLVLTSKQMHDFLLWRDDLPEGLGLKIDEEFKKAGDLRRDNGLIQAFITKVMATLDPQVAEKFGPWIKERITYLAKIHHAALFWWDELEIIAKIRDKEFATYKDLAQALTQYGLTQEKKGDWRRGDRILGNNHDVNDKEPNSYFGTGTMGNIWTDTIVCLNAFTGKELWRKEFPGARAGTFGGTAGASGTPAVWDGKCYATGSAGTYCLDVKDGALIWQAKTSEFTHSSPLVANGAVFCMIPELTSYDAKTGKLLWKQPRLKNCFSSVVPWTSGNTNYIMAMSDGAAYCVNPANGDVVWRCATHNGDMFYTPVICGDIMVAPSIITAVHLSPEKGEVLWSKPPGGGMEGSTPVIYQGYVYIMGIRYADTDICRDLKTGEQKWGFHDQNQSSSAIVADGKIFTVYASPNHGDPRLMMCRPSPEEFALLGFGPYGKPEDRVPRGSTPSIANGRLYVRLEKCIACYDITAAGNPAATPPKRPK